jgi:hypothetical protein
MFPELLSNSASGIKKISSTREPGSTAMIALTKLKVCLLASILVALFAWPLAHQKVDRPAVDREKSAYQDWADRYQKTAKAYAGRLDEFTKMVVITVQGEDEPASKREELTYSRYSMHGAKLHSNGSISTFSQTSMGGSGGSGGRRLTEDQMSQLDYLLAQLPGDGGVLPPVGRRAFLLARLDDGRKIRYVIDTANAPDTLWEVMRLAGWGSGDSLLQFECNSEFLTMPAPTTTPTLLVRSPDRRKFLLASEYGALQVWDETERKLCAEIRRPNTAWQSLVFNPAGTKAAVVTTDGSGTACCVLDAKAFERTELLEPGQELFRLDRATHPQFTADGRFLIVVTSQQTLQAFDTKTWRPVGLPDCLPETADNFQLAPNNQMAVIHSNKEVFLWKTGHRKIPLLDEQGRAAKRWETVAFSPDQSLVAVVGWWNDPPDSQARLYIWETENGKLHRRLRLYEIYDEAKASSLLWSPDGKYLLAGNPDINLWNAQTGRHRAGFAARWHGRVNGMFFSQDERQLIAGSLDGKIRYWDFHDALQRIRALEASLPTLPPALPPPARKSKNPLENELPSKSPFSL